MKCFILIMKNALPVAPVDCLVRRYPSWCCQECGEPIGWLGRFLELLTIAKWHKCDSKFRVGVDSMQKFIRDRIADNSK